MRWISVVSTVSRLLAGQSGVRISAGARVVFFFEIPGRSCGPPSPGRSLAGDKAAGA